MARLRPGDRLPQYLTRHGEFGGTAVQRVQLVAQRVEYTRTLSGSDAPYGDPVVARTTVERVTSSGEVRDRVLGGNLAELLGAA
ncbi:hypothetical protein ABTY96_46330 [Streptomyces sp. NPDC096057]|uniref:hypothetical protein n=1 Tax=Streptomyces sp. NPDC096057 TaxID=3155543 RepID=UPI0033292D3D